MEAGKKWTLEEVADLAAKYGVPERTAISLIAFAQTGRPTGGFLSAVLSNDLFGAVSRADAENEAALTEIVRFVYNVLPASAWGTPELVKAWIKGGGLDSAMFDVEKKA